MRLNSITIPGILPWSGRRRYHARLMIRKNDNSSRRYRRAPSPPPPFPKLVERGSRARVNLFPLVREPTELIRRIYLFHGCGSFRLNYDSRDPRVLPGSNIPPDVNESNIGIRTIFHEWTIRGRRGNGAFPSSRGDLCPP